MRGKKPDQRQLKSNGIGGSAPKPPRFNALGPYGWRKKEDRATSTLGLHPYGIHLGAQVAPQRCPILRMNVKNITVTQMRAATKKRIT